jgi:hypothetical protein
MRHKLQSAGLSRHRDHTSGVMRISSRAACVRAPEGRLTPVMYVNSYISAVSAWTLTGVTTGPRQICKASSVGMLTGIRMTTASSMVSDLHQIVRGTDWRLQPVTDLVGTGHVSVHSAERNGTESIPNGLKFSFMANPSETVHTGCTAEQCNMRCTQASMVSPEPRAVHAGASTHSHPIFWSRRGSITGLSTPSTRNHAGVP